MVAVIDYDAGNIKSVEKAFDYLGADTIVTRDAKEILKADRVVLPGVGSFGDAMRKINEYELAPVIKEVTDKGCTIHFVQQHLEFSNDDSNPTAKLMLQVIGAVGEFEATLIRNRVLEGIAAAKARGNYKNGRPVVMTDEKKKICHEKHAAGIPMTRIAKDLGVSRMSVYRELKKVKI